eukprot:PhM_4_TR16665/c0_g1_i1/m.24221
MMTDSPLTTSSEVTAYTSFPSSPLLPTPSTSNPFPNDPAFSTEPKTPPEGWEHPMKKHFHDIAGVRSFSPFSKCTLDQIKCAHFVRRYSYDIQSHKSRDLHLKAIVMSVEGHEEEDADEPMTDSSFSQYRFYHTFTVELVYFPDKFDFLMMCVQVGVCLVKSCRRFMDIVRSLVAPRPQMAIPREIIDYDEAVLEDERKRVEAFVFKKDWVSTVPELPKSK